MNEILRNIFSHCRSHQTGRRKHFRFNFIETKERIDENRRNEKREILNAIQNA